MKQCLFHQFSYHSVLAVIVPQTFLPGPRVHIAVVHKSLLLSEILLFLCFLRVGHFYPWRQSSRSRLVQSACISFVSKRFEFVRVLRIVVKMNYEQRENYIQTLISEAVFVALSILLSLPVGCNCSTNWRFLLV